MFKKVNPDKFRSTLTAFLLLLLLLLGPWLLLSDLPKIPERFRNSYTSLKQETPTLVDKLTAAISAAEHTVDSTLNQYTQLITIFGGLQRAIGNDVVRDSDGGMTVVRMKNGKITFLDGHSDPAENAGRFNDFAAYNASLDIPTLYLTLPNKVNKYSSDMPTGSYGYANRHGDEFLSLLDPAVDSLDLRETLQSAEHEYDYYFFNTDHHWTPEGAFVGFQAVADRLRGDYGFEIDPAVTDMGSYKRVTYEQYFLGSQGKRVGPLYAGVDDLTILLPVEETSGYTYTIPHKELVRSGSFEDAFLFYENVERKDYYHLNPYVVYSGGDYPLSVAENKNDPSGRKILLIRQSFSCTLAPFLSRACSELDILDLRYYKESVRDYIKSTRPDLVIAAYGAGDCVNDALFEPLAR